MKLMISRLTNSHDNEETSEESPKVEDSSSGALNKVVGVRTTTTNPVRDRGENIGGNDQKRQVDLEQSARQNDKKEANCEDEREGDDGLEAGGRHRGGWGARSGARELEGRWLCSMRVEPVDGCEDSEDTRAARCVVDDTGGLARRGIVHEFGRLRSYASTLRAALDDGYVATEPLWLGMS